MQAQQTTWKEDADAKSVLTEALAVAYEAGAEEKIDNVPSVHYLWEKLMTIIGVGT